MKNKFTSVCFASCILLVITNSTQSNVHVSFNQGMSNFKEYYSANQLDIDSQWALVKELYDANILTDKKPATHPLIPKIIHQIWLGSPLPESCKKFQQSWIKFHPDWKYKLWTEKEIEEFGLQNKKLYDAATNLGEKSDIARYEILYRFGGLYIDTDFECLQPFDYFHHRCTFYTGINLGKNKKANFANGLIGSAPKHPILKECIDTISRSADAKNNAESIINRTGPAHFTRCFFNIIKNSQENVVALPCNFFYPWPHFHRKENKPAQIHKWIKPESFALHHWHRSWAT